MQTATIKIDINGEEFEAEVGFTYTPAIPAQLSGLPEDCATGEPEEFEIENIKVFGRKGETGEKKYFARLDDLVYLIEDSLIESIKEKMQE